MREASGFLFTIYWEHINFKITFSDSLLRQKKHNTVVSSEHARTQAHKLSYINKYNTYTDCSMNGANKIWHIVLAKPLPNFKGTWSTQ